MNKKLPIYIIGVVLILLVLTPIVQANLLDDFLIWLGLKQAEQEKQIMNNEILSPMFKGKFTDNTNVVYSNDEFRIKGYNQDIKLVPYIVKDGAKEYLKNDLQQKTSKRNAIITKDTQLDAFKFGLNISLDKSIDKNKIEQVGWDIVTEKQNDISKANNSLSFGNINIDFSDLIAQGYKLKLGNDLLLRNGSIKHDYSNITITDLAGKDLFLDPWITFTTVANIKIIKMTPLDTNKFGLLFCGVDDVLYLQAWNTNGSQIGSTITVDPNILYCDNFNEITLSVSNTSTLVAGWYEGGAQDEYYFNVYKYNGTDLYNDTGNTLITASGAWGLSIVTDSLNETDNVFCVHQYTNYINAYVYNIWTRTQRVALVPAMLSGTETVAPNCDTKAINSTNFYVSTADKGVPDKFKFAFYTNYGLVNITDITNFFAYQWTGAQYPMALIGILNDTNIVAQHLDYTNGKIIANIFTNYGRTLLYENISIDPAIGLADPFNDMDIATTNSTRWLSAWINNGAGVYNASILNLGTNLKTNINSVSSRVYFSEVPAIISRQYTSGIQICKDSFIVATFPEATNGTWKAYTSTGDLWDGLCSDGLPPTITPSQPANNSILDYIPILFEVNSTDETSLENISLIGNWTTGINETMSLTGQTTNTTNWNINLGNGNYTYQFYVCDSASNCILSENLSLKVNRDLTPPTITLISPANNNLSANGKNIFNCSGTDNFNLSSIQLYSNFTGAWGLNSTYNLAGTSNSTNITINIPDGLYSWTCKVNDTANNIVWANENRSIEVDTQAPDFNITYPLLNDSYFSNQNLYINITYGYDRNLNNCNYSIGADNGAFTCGNNMTKLWSEGQNNLSLSISDTLGHYNNSFRNFYIDLTAPIPSLITPLNYYNSTSNSVTFNCSAIDSLSGLDSFQLYENSTGSFIANQTKSIGGLSNSTTFTINNIPFGKYMWSCLVNDSVNNKAWANENRTFTLYNRTIILNITQPSYANKWFNYSNVYINLTYNLLNLNSCNITDNALASASFICGSNYSKLWGEGQHNITITLNNTYGDSNSTNKTFNVDITNPNIIINNSNNAFYYVTAIGAGNMDVKYYNNDTNPSHCYINHTQDPTLQSIDCAVFSKALFPIIDGDNIVNLQSVDKANNSNFTYRNFTIQVIQENVSYDSPAFETSTIPFMLNITSYLITNISGNLTYNNTFYNVTANVVNSTYGTLIVYINITDVNGGVGRKLNFTYTLNNEFIADTTTYTQSVFFIPPLYTNITCSAGLDSAMCWDFKEENNLTQMTADQVDYNFQYGITNTTFKKDYGKLININSICLCINSTVYNNYTMGYGELKYKKLGYTDRSFYTFSTQRLSNETINNTLYFLANGQATSFLFEMLDTSLNPYTNDYLSLMRWYPSNNSYQIVEMAKTDDKGQSVMRVKAEDTDYRVALYYINGTLIKLLNPIRFACLTSPCSYSVQIAETPLDYTSIYGVQNTLTFNKTTNIWTFTYNDPTQKTTQMELKVSKETALSSTLICDNNATGFTNIIICNSTGINGILKGVAYRTASPKEEIAQLWQNVVGAVVTVQNAFKGTMGLLFTLLICITLFFIGASSPILAVILGPASLVFGLFTLSFNLNVFIGLAVLGGIVVHFISRTSS